MTYMIPRTYQCKKEECKTIFQWSEHHHNLTPFNQPYCPKCYHEFLNKFVSIGELIKERETLDCKLDTNGWEVTKNQVQNISLGNRKETE